MKKRVSGLSIICTILIISLFSTMAFAAESLYLNVTPYVQEQSNWCWAATSKTVISYTGHGNPSQSDIVTAVKGSAVNETASATEDRSSLTKFGVNTTYYGGSLSWSTIKSNINGYKPIKAAIAWVGGGGHVFVIYGFYEDPYVRNVSYENPSDGSFNFTTYSQFCSNSTWTWTNWSLYNNY